MAKISDLFMAGIDELEKSWGWFLALGMLLMILGVACVGMARTATTVSILIFGWILVLSGLVWFLSVFLARGWGGFFLYLLNAIICGATGYLLLTHPNAGAAAITMMLALLFIVGGIFRTTVASLIQFPRWRWTLFSGVVAVILGIVLLANWPAASTFFIGMAIGINLILDGSALMGFAGAIRSLYRAQVYRSA
jgi:uncharacterized membrane protein HdeD (DUF308 family)